MDVKDSLLSGVSLYNSLISKDYSFVLLLIFALENEHNL